MISKATMYLGLNDKDTKIQKYDTVEAYKIVTNEVASRFGGGTISAADGIYRHADGTIVIEKTLRIELLFIERPAVVEFANELKRMFNQESVAIQWESVNSELI